MAGLTPGERLQPSLLDRLRDDLGSAGPGGQGERHGFTAAQLRESVLRDLSWLLNCVRRSPPEDGARVEASVLCFGIPDLAGMHAEGHDTDGFRRALHAAIERFEPRLLPGSLHVEVERRAPVHGRRALAFRIDAVLWAQPLPLRMRINTEADMETFRFTIVDAPE